MGQALDLRRLVDLLKSLFSVDDLRRWIHQSFGRAVADELPGSGTGLAQFASDVAMTLERHGLIGPALFEELMKERPARREEILAVAQDVGASASPSTGDAMGEASAKVFDRLHNHQSGDAPAVTKLISTPAAGSTWHVQIGGPRDQARQDISFNEYHRDQSVRPARMGLIARLARLFGFGGDT